jgi:hypothetical protein
VECPAELLTQTIAGVCIRKFKTRMDGGNVGKTLEFFAHQFLRLREPVAVQLGQVALQIHSHAVHLLHVASLSRGGTNPVTQTILEA